tara:strand:- start:3733 stop:3855 length:123 start_codon:yes stop_codon:yes gene_type:complete
MSHEEDKYPEAPYEDGGAINFSIVYTIAAIACIAAVLIFT